MSLDVYVHDDKVTVDLGGIDQLWCLKRHLEIPTADIRSARVVSREDLAPLRGGFKVAGARIPGVVEAGHFSVPDRPGARQFWCVYRDPEVLVIETDLERPARVVLQHPDRERLAWLIAERIPST